MNIHFIYYKNKIKISPLKIIFIHKIQEFARVKIALNYDIQIPKFCSINNIFYGRFLFFTKIKDIFWIFFVADLNKDYIDTHKTLIVYHPYKNQIHLDPQSYNDDLSIITYNKIIEKLPTKYFTFSKIIKPQITMLDDKNIIDLSDQINLLFTQMSEANRLSNMLNIVEYLKKSGHKIIKVTFGQQIILIVEFFGDHIMNTEYQLLIENTNPMASGDRYISEQYQEIFLENIDLDKNKNFQNIIQQIQFENSFLKTTIKCDIQAKIIAGDLINNALVLSVKHIFTSRSSFSILVLLEDPYKMQYKYKVNIEPQYHIPDIKLYINLKKNEIIVNNIKTNKILKCYIYVQ